METVKITKKRYTQIFGGMGFNNIEAMMYKAIEKEHFDQILCKCYREVAPGFMRTFAGYSDQTKESMDAFCEYYERMQKVTDTPIFLTTTRAKVNFTEEEMTEYCEKVADKLAYMKKEKGMDHIRYYCFSGEMSEGDWGKLMTDLPRLKQYHELLYRAFKKRELDIGLLATEATGYPNWDTMDWAIRNMNAITEDYSLHIYDNSHKLDDLTFYDFFYDKCNEKVMKAIKTDGKRLILAEMGIQDGIPGLTYGNGCVVDVCRFLEDPETCAMAGLVLVEMAFAAVNAGVYALAYWSYADLPDPYSCAHSEKPGYAREWGKSERFLLPGTTDIRYNKWGSFRWTDDGDYSPKDVWFGLAPMIKLFKRNAKVLTIETEDKNLRCCGVMNRDGSVSVGIVNRNQEPTQITLDSTLFKKNIRVYEFDPNNVPYNSFGDLQGVSAVVDAENPTYTLKGTSVTFFTTDYEEKTQQVVAQELNLTDGVLTWKPVSDPNHCYYRIYAGESADFVPGPENQIASTVACDLPVSDSWLCYKVLSVDQWGNV